jgi:hypothetical protein
MPVEQPSAPVAPADTTNVLVERSSHQLPLVIGLAIFGMLVALVSAVKVVENQFFQPEHTVISFFDALGNRDATAARNLLLPPTDEEYSQALLQPAALKSAGYSPPTAARVEQTDSKDDRATVRVSFSLNGRRHALILDLRRDDHATAGLFHRWRIAGGVYPVSVSAAGVDSILAAGAPIPFTVGTSTLTLAAYPGGYQVTLPDQPLWEAAPTVAYAGITDGVSDPGAVTLEPTIKSGVRTTIDQQVRSYLDDCAKSTTLAPDNCPFSKYSYYEVRDVRWTIVKYPQYAVGRSYSGQAVVTNTGDGEADVTGQEVWSYGSGTYPYSASATFRVSGTVAVTGSAVTFQPQKQ